MVNDVRKLINKTANYLTSEDSSDVEETVARSRL